MRIFICVLTLNERGGWLNPYLFQARGQWEKDPNCRMSVQHNTKPHAFARNQAADKMLQQKPLPDVFIMIDNDVAPELYGEPVNVPEIARFVTPNRMVVCPVPILDRRAAVMNTYRFVLGDDGQPIPDKADGRPALRTLGSLEVLEANEAPNNLLRVDSAGFGVVAIHRRTIIEAMARRDFAFRTEYRADGSVKISEDHEFCLFAGREMGVEVWAAFGHICDHLKTGAALDLALTRKEIEDSTQEVVAEAPKGEVRAGDPDHDTGPESLDDVSRGRAATLAKQGFTVADGIRVPADRAAIASYAPDWRCERCKFVNNPVRGRCRNCGADGPTMLDSANNWVPPTKWNTLPPRQ